MVALRVSRNEICTSEYSVKWLCFEVFIMEVNKLASCPECNSNVSLPTDAVQGEILDCPDCGIELEIVNPSSGELRVADVEGEDWGE